MFKLGDLIIDRIVEGIGEVISGIDAGKMLFRLTNLQDTEISITADSVDAVDGTGTPIKTFYRGKQGELTATNSTISLPVIEQMGGTKAQYASAGTPITMPRIITASRATGTGDVAVVVAGITDTSITDHSVVVHAVADNGTLGEQIPASALALTAPGQDETASTLTITDADETHHAWIIKYNREVTQNGIMIINESNKFPKTIKLTLKVLIVDPCAVDQITAAYIILPSFQPSAELSFNLTTDATIDFSGRLQTAYCASVKTLYMITVCSDDEEEE